METAEQLSSSRTVVRSGFFNLVGFLASAVYMIVLVPVAKQYLGMDHYGLWTTILAVTGYIGLADMGLSTSFVTYIARFVTGRSYDEATRVVHLGLLFYAGLSLAMFAVAIVAHPLLFQILRIPATEYLTARNALFIVLGVFTLTSVGGVLGNALASIQRTDLVNIVSAATLVVKLVAAVIVLHLGYGLVGLLTADLCVTTATIPVMIALTKAYMPYLALRWKGYDAALMKKLLSFGASMQVTRLADIVLGSFDKLLLTPFFGLGAVSMYDFGSRPAGRIRVFPAAAILSLVAAVSALDVQGNEARIRAALVRSTRYLAIVSAPLFSFCMVFAEPLMLAWLGPGMEQAAMTLRLLSSGFFVSSVVSALSAIAVGRGQPQHQMWAMIAQTVLNIVLSTTLILTWGFYGAAVGTTTATLVGALLFFWLAGRHILDHPVRLLIAIMFKPLLCTGLASLLPFCLFVVLHDPLAKSGPALLWSALLLAALVGGIQYVLALRWTRTIDADDVRFVRGVLPRRFAANA